jgi:hypothetical protein
MTKKWCPLYPTPAEDTCICGGGSDVSGTTEEDVYCSVEYAKTCPSANNDEEES